MVTNSAWRKTLELLSTAILIASPALADQVERPRIDHILLGVGDLDRGVEFLAKITGVRPVYGGKHPGGTHNALLSLGDDTYLELIAIQPGVRAPEGWQHLIGLAEPSPVGWAVSAPDAPALRQELERAGFALTAAEPGSRTTPSGQKLQWEAFGVAETLEQAPFFIVWSTATAHPATTSPAGCKLRRFLISTPDAQKLQKLVHALSLPVEIAPAATAAFSLALDCPQGPVTFKHP
jgi:catechol 2,3-dioxygenase-like lactoylglutathione lyase family enzyme